MILSVIKNIGTKKEERDHKIGIRKIINKINSTFHHPVIILYKETIQ